MLRSVPSFMLACLALMLASCSSNHVKKVIVMANGKLTVDESKQKLKLEPSNTHNEEELVFNSGDKITLSVESPNGTKTYNVDNDGVYLLNLKTDTLTGGIVNYSAEGRASSMSREQLDHMIDSTQQLIEGRNVSDANKNYFVIPGNIKKITENTKARLIGPYKGIPYQVDEGAEIYKFFTNKQQRESLGDLLNRMNTKK
ncbi:MAG TPA: hypothetical protein VEB42_11850 [Chitinophagaceae bacterium]|nr:hypothetical protein [Chitinophagaceae bacterium]